MKKVAMIITAICILAFSLYAKKENVITRMYAGYLTYTTYDKDLSVASGTDWRIGGVVSLPLKVGSIEAYSVFGDGFSITSYAWKMSGFQIGKIARPITLHRPWPPSANSHFERQSLGAIPGGGLGACYLLGSKKNNLVLAVHETKNTTNSSIAEFGIGTQLFGSVRISANRNNEQSGIAGTYNGKKLSLTTYMNSDSVMTNFINYKITEKTAVYSDFNYCPQGINKYEVGITINTTSMVDKIPLNVLLGTGVVYHDPVIDPTLPEWSLNLYIFVTKIYNRK